MKPHLTDIQSFPRYDVRLEFSKGFEPSIISDKGLPFVSLMTEIDANSITSNGKRIREQYGRITYGSPLYLWEIRGEQKEIIYIGQTVKQTIQKRFEKHSQIIKVLTRFVNDPNIKVYFRVCTRLEIQTSERGLVHRSPIEFFNVAHAKRIIDDIEAYLIYKYKPKFNTIYVSHEKKYWKPFNIYSEIYQE